jgi:hypothetical protein
LSYNRNYSIYYRNHLVIPKVSWKGLPMQDLACCDNNRTPVIFQGLDNYRIVGVRCNLSNKKSRAISSPADLKQL